MPDKPAKAVPCPDEFAGTVIEEMLSQMKMPPRGAKAEKQSFRKQNGTFEKQFYSFSKEQVQAVASLYPRTLVPSFLESYNTEGWYDAFRTAFNEALQDMEDDKTPGALWSQIGRNNGHLIETFYVEVLQAVEHLLRVCLLEDFSQIDAQDMFLRTGVCYKVFVKGEPHTNEKVDSGRQRLVFASPFHMTILERMIFGPQNKADIDNWRTCPSKPGLTMDREGATELAANVADFGVPLCSTDQKGWDWHVQEWTMFADVEIRRELLEGSSRSIQRWHRIAKNMTHLLAKKTIVFSDGLIICQDEDNGGIWPSGSYRTSGTNSRMRVAVRLAAVGDLNIITMGDDAVEGYHNNLQYMYQEIGYELKDPVEVTSDRFEFCSKWFTRGAVYPVDNSVRKMVTNLIRHPCAQAAESIQQELRYSEYYGVLTDLGLFNEWWVARPAASP